MQDALSRLQKENAGLRRRLPSMERLLSIRFGIAFVIMVVLSLMVGSVGSYKLSVASLTREREQALDALALSISPMVARFDLADVTTLLDAMQGSMGLKAIQIEDYYGKLHSPIASRPGQGEPDKIITLYDRRGERVGELRVWWGADSAVAAIFLNGVGIALAEILLVLSASWILFARTLRHHVTTPVKELRDFVLRAPGEERIAPDVDTRELSDLVGAFERSWQVAMKRTEEKAEALSELHKAMQRQVAMTEAVQDALARARMAICYRPAQDGSRPIFLGEELPWSLHGIALRYHENGGDLRHAAAESDEAHDILQLPSPNGVAAGWLSVLEVRLSETETWTFTPVALESGSTALIVQEVSGQKQAEEKRQEVHKLESLGVLTSGVAHDFNNILGIISGAIDIQQEETGESDALHHARTASDRGRSLVRQLLDVSRRKVSKLSNIDQASALRNVISAMPASLGHNYQLNVDIQTEAAVVAEEDLLETTLVNLVVNARDAMPDGGKITVRSREASEVEQRKAGLEPGDYIVIEVIDNGPGIAPETMRQIFDPFFTTKPKGKGTGLGLSMAHAFSRRSGGVITCDSEPEKGTTFRIFLRQATGSFVTLRPKSEQKPKHSAEKKRVFLIDDEAGLLAVASSFLRHRGYQVDCATGVVEAQEMLAETPPSAYALIVTDMYMPDGTGLDIARTLLSYEGANPVFYLASGNVDLARFTQEQRSWFDGFLAKPYELKDLEALAVSAPIPEMTKEKRVLA